MTKKQTGFTIVELLIVIVVIGILAAITIVAYNGITQKAIISSLQSDLSNSSQQLKLYQVNNGNYPNGLDCSASPAADTICLKSSPNTTYTTYLPNNSSSPQSFCLTATTGTTNYFINQDVPAQSGACAITNLADNPSIESSLNNIGTGGYGTGGAGSITQTADGYSGTYAATQTWSTAASGGGASIYEGLSSGTYTIPVRPSTTYYMSAYCKVNTSIGIVLYSIQSSNTSGSSAAANQSGTQVVSANQWIRLSLRVTTNPSTSYIVFGCRIPNLSGTSAGLTMKMDDAMLTEGPTLYNYADGNTPGWYWFGTPNDSTSSGPPQ